MGRIGQAIYVNGDALKDGGGLLSSTHSTLLPLLKLLPQLLVLKVHVLAKVTIMVHGITIFARHVRCRGTRPNKGQAALILTRPVASACDPDAKVTTTDDGEAWAGLLNDDRERIIRAARLSTYSTCRHATWARFAPRVATSNLTHAQDT